MDFTLTAHFNTSPQTLYDTWLESSGHEAMTGGEAKISPKEGDTFQCWDGYIWGENLALVPGQKILQSWKTSDFKPEQGFSKVEITLIEDGKGTLLTIHHSELTDEDEHYIRGWEEHYFAPMKAYFDSISE